MLTERDKPGPRPRHPFGGVSAPSQGPAASERVAGGEGVLFHPQMAPWAADPTSFAYLPSTPVV